MRSAVQAASGGERPSVVLHTSTVKPTPIEAASAAREGTYAPASIDKKASAAPRDRSGSPTAWTPCPPPPRPAPPRPRR